MKIIFIVEFKRHVVNASILSIIIGKFRYKKKPYSVILFKIDKVLKINFYHTILFFDLTIYLWIKDIKKTLLNAKKII